MLKKTRFPKRRIRNFIPTLIALIVVFFLTTGSLFAWYFWQQAHKPIVSPMIVHVVKKDAPAIQPETGTLDDLLKKNGFNPVAETEASDSALFVTLDSGEQILFSQKKDFSQQIASLQLVRRQLTIEGKRLLRVDFRFDNPVISY